MAKAQPIKYRDTMAMPGSELYEHLAKGDTKKAEACYQETEKRYQKMMGTTPKPKEQNGNQESQNVKPS